MGDLTLSQYQSAVLRACGNLSSSHPLVSAGDHTRAINDAANRLIRMFPDKFPEHQDRSWTVGPTTTSAPNSRVSLPSNLFYLEKVRHNGSSSDPTSWSAITEQVVSPTSPETIGLLSKTSATVGYPQLWARKNNTLLYWPTTQTGYTCYFRLYGMSKEDALSASGDTFRLDADWDQAIVYLAAAEVAMLADRAERSSELRAEAERILGTSISTPAAERRVQPSQITIAGTPR